MTSRLSERELSRLEIQDLFHQGFNILQSFRTHLTYLARPDVRGTDTTPVLDEMSRLLAQLTTIEEAIRARMIPLLA